MTEAYAVLPHGVVVRHTPWGFALDAASAGVSVTWSIVDGRIQVQASDENKHKLCGLCGNFNGEASDDTISSFAEDNSYEYAVQQVVGYSSHLLKFANRSCSDA